MRRRLDVVPDDLLRPVAQRVQLTRAEREALRRLREALRTRGAHGFDPLELRLGLRAQYRQNRPGYAVSNPTYHRLLLAHPEHDESLGGRWWLRDVYYGRDFRLTALPPVRALVRARFDAAERETRAAWQRSAPPPAQARLFDAACREAHAA